MRNKIPNVTSPFTHTNLANSRTYYYIITATAYDKSEIRFAKEVSAIPIGNATRPPTPNFSNAIAGDKQIIISFEEFAEAASYNLYYTFPGSLLFKVSNITTPHILNNLSNGRTYSLFIRAVGVGGVESFNSFTKIATPVGIPEVTNIDSIVPNDRSHLL